MKTTEKGATREHRIVLALDQRGQWDGLYVNGRRVVQDTTLYAMDVLVALQGLEGKIRTEQVHVHMGTASSLPRHEVTMRTWIIPGAERQKGVEYGDR